MNLPIALFFGWPTGAVWSNLVASLICVGFVWWRVRARMIAQHFERLAQAERHHLEQLAAAKAGRRPLMSGEEFERNLAEMMPPVNCFGCGYSGPLAGHVARHDAYLAALAAQRSGGGGGSGVVTPGSAEVDELAAEYQRQQQARPGGERM